MVEMCTSIRVVCSRLRKLAAPNNQKVSSYVTLTFTTGIANAQQGIQPF